MVETLRKNRALIITLLVLALLFVAAIQGMEPQNWVITLLRGLAVGAITFLVASGLSLIFGLLDVLNLAHGTLFMLGAYVGWTVYVRPDTFIDSLAPVALLAGGFFTRPVGDALLGRITLPARLARVWPWVVLVLAIVVVALAFSAWPIAKWNPDTPTQAPAADALALDQALQTNSPRPIPAQAASASVPPAVSLGGVLLGGALLAFSLSGMARRQQAASAATQPVSWKNLALPLVLVVIGLLAHLLDEPLTQLLFGLHTSVLFLVAILVTMGTGAALGGIMESTLVRPLYARPIYQLMLTLGLGVSGIEVARAIWGRPEFTLPRLEAFRGAGAGCPATSLAGWLENGCSTLLFMEGRVRTYNEIFVILVGVIVLVAVWVLLQRSRLGMIIRAGVQDSEMVEALGINVRQVFTLVFALGASLAALGGVIAAPSVGLSTLMGENYLLMALIALAIGGLTSFPGAAAGSLLVGVLQQFIIKYGQIGIQLPFMSEPFKPTPPLVPSSTVLLMVIILLVLPQGLFGRKE